MTERGKPTPADPARPTLEIVIDPVALFIPTLLALAAGVGAEEHAAGPQSREKSVQNALQVRSGDMEDRRIGENAVKAFGGKIESQKILVQDLAPRVAARHGAEGLAAVEPGGQDAPFRQRLEVTPRPAPEVEHALADPALRQT